MTRMPETFQTALSQPLVRVPILMRRLKVQGFIVIDYAERFQEASMQLMQWMMEGKIKAKMDIRPGLENAVETVRDLYTGGNFGKLLVEVKAP